MPQVSSALLLDMVATGKEFTIKNTQWRHNFDSARQRFFTMVFRCPPWFSALETASLKFPSLLLLKLQLVGLLTSTGAAGCCCTL